MQQVILKEKGVESDEDAADQSTEPSEFREILQERIMIINFKKLITDELQQLVGHSGVADPFNSQLRSQLLQEVAEEEKEFDGIDDEDA